MSGALSRTPCGNACYVCTCVRIWAIEPRPEAHLDVTVNPPAFVHVLKSFKHLLNDRRHRLPVVEALQAGSKPC